MAILTVGQRPLPDKPTNPTPWPDDPKDPPKEKA